jgi:hypothetical protein
MDITIPNTFISSSAATADALNANIYGDIGSGLNTINGYLDSNNKASDWTVDEGQIRDQTLASGRMVGSTGNLDYVHLIFPKDNDDSGAYQAIPGASIYFYLPYAPSATILTWTIQGVSNQTMGSRYTGDGAAEPNEYKLYIDNSFVSHQFRAFAPARDGDTLNAHRFWRDRIWSGHCLKTDMGKGFHRAEVRIFNAAGGTGTARIRIRNMKVVYFK